MAWPMPKFSKTRVNRAGTTLAADAPELDEWMEAYDVLTNWRGCHGYPINTFQATLRGKLKTIDDGALVAQRLKRFPSIINKLRRQNSMMLSRMQDIGGLRAVVTNLNIARALEGGYRSSKFAHELVSEHDYIKAPKLSGYRSMHLVYRYRSSIARAYDGLLIELQIRTKLQHAWAMAVETMGTLINQSLKSSEGPEEWLRFFALCASAFAYFEKCPPVPGFEHLSKEETFLKTALESKRLGIKEKLRGFSTAVESIPVNFMRAGYYLIVLDLEAKTVKIEPFAREKIDEANKTYSDIEQEVTLGRRVQAVLVSAGSVESLRRAYPSFFLDTHDFLISLNKVERFARGNA